MKLFQKPIIAITIGDVSGIGPEIALKAWLKREVHMCCRPLMIGDSQILNQLINRFQLPLQLNVIGRVSEALFLPGRVDVIDLNNIDMSKFRFGHGNAMTGKAMLEYTEHAVSLALIKEVHAVVGGPHTKASAEKAGVPFEGYPKFIAQLTGTNEEEAFLMLVSGSFRVVNTTLHVPLRKALEQLKRPLIEKAIQAAYSAGRKLGLKNPRIAVAGLNPHAGEGGLYGREEREEIAPAVQNAKQAGIQVEGPFASDLLFAQLGQHDIYIAMYHDQAHIPMKMKALKNISAMTIGTPVLFASVGHGSAPDIAGKGVADPSGLIQTIRLLSSLDEVEGLNKIEKKGV